MKVLILGGTHFLGRHFVERALIQGYEVTIFNRGKSNPHLYPEVEKLVGDRVKGDLDALKGREWDAVIDTAGYIRKVVQAVRDTAELLKERIKHYTFISSLEAYNDPQANFDETSPTHPTDGKPPKHNYGIKKSFCESIVTEVYGSRGLNVRAGLIVGPYDWIDRFPYWVRRVAQGGEVLAPESPDLPVQLIDARDIADWVYKMATAQKGGAYNITGPDYPLTLGKVLETCKQVSGSDATFTWVPGDFLTEQKVRHWHEMPLWTPLEKLKALTSSCKIDKAIGAGLTFRPLLDTVRDTLAWDKTRSPKDKHKQAGGLAKKKEQAVLKAWHARNPE